MTTLHELSLETLKELDNGKVPAAWNLHVQRALNDCHDRPAEKKPRTVTLTVEIVPICDQHGIAETVDTQFKLTSSVPKHQTRVYPLTLRKRSGKPVAVFSEVTPDGSPSLFDEPEQD